MSQTKVCTKCKINKSVNDFKKRNSKSGYRSECRECEKAYRFINKNIIAQKRKNAYQKKKKDKQAKHTQEIILKFINGPLQSYLTGDISFGKFKELINETCGTNFSYSDLYPSYLFNGMIHYPHNEFMEIKPHKQTDCVEYSEGGLPCPECIPAGCSGVIPDTFIMCGEMGQYCSQECMRKGK